MGITILDNIARVGMAAGILCIFQPWWQNGLRVGFFATAIFTILHIITSHLVKEETP